VKRYLLTIALLCLVATGAQSFWQSRQQVAIVTGGGGYTGPGDVTTFVVWYGLRAYSAAYAASLGPCIGLVDQAGANAITINVLANGDVDVASVSTWVTAHSVTTIRVSDLFNQASAGHTLHQGTLAAMPVLGLSVLGSHPAIQNTTTTDVVDAGGTLTQAQPLTISTVAERTSLNGTGLQVIFGNQSVDPSVGYHGANTAILFAGSFSADVTATDSVFHAFQGVFNGASSSLMVDTTANTGLNPGTDGISSNGMMINNGSFPSIQNFLEAGLISGAASGTIQTNLNSNQKTYWGY